MTTTHDLDTTVLADHHEPETRSSRAAQIAVDAARREAFDGGVEAGRRDVIGLVLRVLGGEPRPCVSYAPLGAMLDRVEALVRPVPADHHEPARGDAVRVDDERLDAVRRMNDERGKGLADTAAALGIGQWVPIEEIVARAKTLVRERDAYKRAKAENDEPARNAIDSVATALGMDPGALPGAVVERAEMLVRERAAARDDLVSCENDLARLLTACRGWSDLPPVAPALCDDIETNGSDGWIARALSPETVGPVRKERDAWQARVDAAVSEGERRLDNADAELAKVIEDRDALDAELRQYEDGAAEVRSALGATDDETTLDAARRVVAERRDVTSDRTEDQSAEIARLTERLSYYELGHYDGLLADLRKRLGMDAAGRPLASEGSE